MRDVLKRSRALLENSRRLRSDSTALIRGSKEIFSTVAKSMQKAKEAELKLKESSANQHRDTEK